MPCYITGSAEGDARLNAQEAAEEAQRVTRMLCNALGMLEAHGIPLTPGSDLARYWEAHKAKDAARAEMLKRDAKARQAESEAAEFLKRRRQELGLE